MTASQTTRTPALAGKMGFSLISDEKFRTLYSALLQCELLDERLRSAPGYERWTGREAASAAVAACLRGGDSIAVTRRGVLAGYLHTGQVKGTISPAKPASQLAAANQEGMRRKRDGGGNVVVVFSRASQPGPMRKLFAEAARQSLPVLYVLEGKMPPADDCAGIPLIRVDASDTVALYRVAYESITRARDGGGPTILECAPWPAEPGPNPLLKLESYLAAKKLFRPHWKRRLEKRYGEALDAAVKASAASPE